MFCTACGYSMSENDRYCARCGKPEKDGQYQWSAAPTSPAREPTRLERNMYDVKIAGVCSGFAKFFRMDPSLMRMIWVLLAVFTGTTLIAYPICWFIMPRNDVKLLPGPAYQQ